MRKIVLTLILVLALARCSYQPDQQLQAENKALREKVAQLEAQLDKANSKERLPQPEAGRGTREINKENLLLAKKIQASPSDFLDQEVKLHCEFSGINTSWLNKKGPYYPPSIFFSSSDYLGFFASVHPTGRIDTTTINLQHLFIPKRGGDILYQLDSGDPITIYGKVRGDYLNNPWIEVNEIKRGWE